MTIINKNMADHYCLSKENKIKILTSLALEGKSIYLYGAGNNGKTYIINQLRNNALRNYIIHEDPFESPSDIKHINDGRKHMYVSNFLPNDKNQVSGCVVVEFTGVYNSKYGDYV
jgi:hypothetical protein